MHNPYKAKLALLAASFVTASSLSACIPTINPAPVEEPETVTPEPVPPPEIAVNPAPPPPEPPAPEPEIAVNPAPPPAPE